MPRQTFFLVYLDSFFRVHTRRERTMWLPEYFLYFTHTHDKSLLRKSVRFSTLFLANSFLFRACREGEIFEETDIKYVQNAKRHDNQRRALVIYLLFVILHRLSEELTEIKMKMMILRTHENRKNVKYIVFVVFLPFSRLRLKKIFQLASETTERRERIFRLEKCQTHDALTQMHSYKMRERVENLSESENFLHERERERVRIVENYWHWKI